MSEREIEAEEARLEAFLSRPDETDALLLDEFARLEREVAERQEAEAEAEAEAERKRKASLVDISAIARPFLHRAYDQGYTDGYLQAQTDANRKEG